MRTHFAASVLLLIALLIAGCGRSSRHHPSFFGSVVDGTGAGVARATVFLIPARKVDTSTILAKTILSGEAEPYDEPLEDAADSGDPAIRTAVTEANGAFGFGPIPDGSYFVFVRPDAADTAHLPGGDRCRVARTAAELSGGLTIKLSGQPTTKAVFVGSSTCLKCHAAGYANHKFTGHALGIMPPGQPSKLQDPAKYPRFYDGLAKFTTASAYSDPKVTVLFCEDFDKKRGFDKFKVFEGATGGGTVYLKAYLWRHATTGVYKITLENVLNTLDPNSPVTYDVRLTYGGAVFKQRYMVRIPGRKGHYPTLQYQYDGKNSHYDRTRKVFRDYHLDWYWNDSTKTLRPPPTSKTFEGNCAACHLPGYKAYKDITTGEWLTRATPDAGSNYDISGDGKPDELNVGCEKCHGPGSEHTNSGKAASIVAVSRLSPSRANQICGFCHDRQKGNGNGLVNDSPLNQNNEFPRPGTRRADYLKNYITRKGPSAKEIWKEFDAIHAKSHHEHFPDMLKSKHARNSRRLVVCSDCHDTHDKKFPAQLKYSVKPDSALCQQCHAVDVTKHMTAKVGTPMTGAVTSCVACHMPKTAKTGAGKMGLTLGTPTGGPSDASIVYWENDITSHTMMVPSRFTAFGVTPGSAMPAPYTNACGICHNASSLASIDRFDPAACGGCHTGTLNEWKQSGHSKLVTEVTGSTSPSRPGACFRCHIGQQFIKESVAGDGAYAGSLPYPKPAATGCVVCHYPHFGNAIARDRLRMEGKVRLPEGPPANPDAGTYVELGKGRICVSCHNSRRSDPVKGSAAVWNASASAWRLTDTPHAANQGETYLGFGAATSFSTGGLNEPSISDSFHATQDFTLPGGDRKFHGCVTCHMFKGKNSKPHTWKPVIDLCARCHATNTDWPDWGGAKTPTFRRPARGDYDGDGTTEDIQAEYEGLLARILAGLTDGKGSGIGSPEKGFGYTWLGGYPYWNLGTNQNTPPDADAAMVARNHVLFEHDPGACYHNPAYAFQVLRASWQVLGRKLLGNNAWTPPGDAWTDVVR